MEKKVGLQQKTSLSEKSRASEKKLYIKIIPKENSRASKSDKKLPLKM